jgi:glycosyltransferase involved in cell wall biosynthesis
VKLAAVVPTMNEQETIGALVRTLNRWCDLVIVSDDSDDATSLHALNEGAKVVDPPPGLGPAYLAAWAQIDPSWWVLHVDAGGSHPDQSIARVVNYARGGNADLYIGSRFVEGASHQGKVTRKYTSKAAGFACSLASGLDIRDWTSGLRIYSPRARAMLAQHPFRTSGHAWQMEALAQIVDRRWRVEEVPIDYHPSRSNLNAHRIGEAFQVWMTLWA